MRTIVQTPFRSGGTSSGEISYKTPVRCATTVGDTLALMIPGYVMDGVTLANNDRFLVWNQALAKENGIYVAHTGLPPTRALDANGAGEVRAGMVVMVTEGDTQADEMYVLITNDPIVLDVDPLTFMPYGLPEGISKDDQDLAALATVNDEDDALATGITNTPQADGNVKVLVNGCAVKLGNGSKVADCYFSALLTPSVARLIKDIVAGDILHWVGSLAGYQLDTSDNISLVYLV